MNGENLEKLVMDKNRMDMLEALNDKEEEAKKLLLITIIFTSICSIAYIFTPYILGILLLGLTEVITLTLLLLQRNEEKQLVEIRYLLQRIEKLLQRIEKNTRKRRK